MASRKDYLEEKTEVIYDAENIIEYALNHISILRSYVDNCIDSISPHNFVIPNHPITKAYQDMKKRGIKIRFITEITKENIQYCKELMNISEVRHLDEIKGNFGIADGILYTGGANSIPSSPPPLLLISSTATAFVEQQQYFFDMLWRKAIPAIQRIKEIEEGVKREFIEVSTANTFRRYDREGIIELLTRKANEGVKLRMLLNQSRPPTIFRETQDAPANNY